MVSRAMAVLLGLRDGRCRPRSFSWIWPPKTRVLGTGRRGPSFRLGESARSNFAELSVLARLTHGAILGGHRRERRLASSFDGKHLRLRWCLLFVWELSVDERNEGKTLQVCVEWCPWITHKVWGVFVMMAT